MRSSGANRRPRASSRCRGRSSCNSRAPMSGRPRRSARPCASATRCGWVGRAAPPWRSPTIRPCASTSARRCSCAASPRKQRSLIDLILGGVYFFSHRPRALEVDTPFVNAAAEGTEFLVRVGADRAEVVDARRPRAAAQSARRAAGRERRCRADPGGARRRGRWWWRGRAMPWPGRCTIRRS